MKIVTLLFFFLSWRANAQINPSVKPIAPIRHGPFARSPAPASQSMDQILRETANGLPNIVLIGYWNPTNEMVREFSARREQNPGGWQGQNWEGRGYNVYSFFPEFPDGRNSGLGDFQVDYQSTSHDFWSIIPEFDPVAILSFGRAESNNDWRIELNTRNLASWIADDLAPFYPTPSPPDESRAADTSIRSRFPSAKIISALENAFPALVPSVNKTGAGGYLCEYLGYHLSWYRALHPRRMQFAAHTHIGSATDLSQLKTALKISLRVLIDSLKPSPALPDREMPEKAP